jgi:nucleoside-diphosphate-sugar epimerase
VRILLTGASSFTGYWFARALAEAGHEVVAPLRRAAADYTEGNRAERVRRLPQLAHIVWETAFGGDRFLALLDETRCELLCHHAARVGADYASPDFDVAAALAENTSNLPEVLRRFAAAGGRGVVATGSFFEFDEGAGSQPLRAFSPYGLSKGLTALVLRHWCAALGIPFGKFVLPHPFGPLEEPRFTAYLFRTWKAGQTAEVRTPLYVRDNIHVGLAALAYARFAAATAGGPAFAKANPSGYVERQGSFAQRLAAEMAPRTGLACAVTLANQTSFPEPLVRLNTEPAAPAFPEWQEAAAWDALAEAHA